MASEYTHEDDAGDSVGTGELNIMSVELQDCKELEQPFPLQASLCRKGVCVIMKDAPAKVSELKISKTGKHGSSKANMVGYDVITNRKYRQSNLNTQPQRNATQPSHAQAHPLTSRPSLHHLSMCMFNQRRLFQVTPPCFLMR